MSAVAGKRSAAAERARYHAAPARAAHGRDHAHTHDLPSTPLHVLQVFQPETGGVPRYAATLAEGLQASGWRVSVACPPRASLSDTLRASGVDVLTLDVGRSPQPWRDVRAIRKLAAWCREREVSLLHGHSTKAGLLVAMAGRKAGVPSVYSPHGWVFERLVPRSLRALYALFERQLAQHHHAAVVSVSASERKAAERWGVAPRGRVQVVPTGLPALPSVGRARARRMLGVADDAVVAAWVGRVGAQKRPEDLVPLARALTGKVRVVALCDGVRETRLADELRAAGVVVADPGCDPAVVYSAADMLLHTSDWEAFPLVVLEAMSSSLPVVAYDVGGLREQVQPGRTGYLVRRGDLDMMAECALALARQPHLRARMGEAGYHRVCTRFSYSSMLDRIGRTYLAVAGPPSPDAISIGAGAGAARSSLRGISEALL